MNLIRLVILALLLTACATPKNNVRFYSLTPATPAKNQAGNTLTSSAMAIEVLPVNVPERLKRPQLVISSNSAELKMLEQDRWSSSFNDELQDAFVSALSLQLDAIDISRGGRIANQPTYRIGIVLQQFTATPGDQVQAHFGWTITRLNADARENKAISCQATFIKPVSNSIQNVVQGIQTTVMEATQAIAANVTRLNLSDNSQCAN